jgi:hypothetical protein
VLHYLIKILDTKYKIHMSATKAHGIQKGETTHHHDHAITPQSFKTINTISSTDKNDSPPASLSIDIPLF